MESGDSDRLSGDVGAFSNYLQRNGRRYLLLDEPGGDRVRVRFCGPFQGMEVVWNCELVTLDREFRRPAPDADSGGPGGLRRFIEIGPPGAEGYPVRVGLNLPRIDLPAIEKMIIMLRNYKRLSPGRHEYGETVPRS